MPSDRFQESYRVGNPYDLAEQIGEDGIAKLLALVCEAYNMLCNHKIVKLGMSEDEITEELFKEIQIVWRASTIPQTIIPINQKIDKTLAKNIGKPPAIDFCFRDRWVKEAFFGFECKLLAEGNVRLYKEYVENGLFRYLQGKYCAKGSAGSLIGYVNSGRISVIVQDVKTRVDKESILTAMVKASSISAFEEHYVSTHSREGGLSSFCVHHLFFCFSALN